MGHAPRHEVPHGWQHVMSRAVADRVVFESRADCRYFMACMARVVRAGLLEVHAFVVLPTHYHLLVSSPSGQLVEAMLRVQYQYSRWFNRRRKQKGSLLCGHFSSKRVDDADYRHTLVSYIDQSPVQAQIVRHPALYPYGSAYLYARQRRPKWLSQRWIPELVTSRMRSGDSFRAAYERIFVTDPLQRASDAQLSLWSKAPQIKPVALNQIQAASPRVVRWMQRKAALAEGVNLGDGSVSAAALEQAWKVERLQDPDWKLSHQGHKISAWDLVLRAAYRDLCGLPYEEIGERTGETKQLASRDYQRHLAQLKRDTRYQVTFKAFVAKVAQRHRAPV